MGQIILMRAASRQVPGGEGVSVSSPVWSHIEDRLRQAFYYGGGVELTVGIPITDTRTTLGVALGMTSHPGECQITYVPETESGEKSKVRQWWQLNDLPFSGTVIFNDHPFDSRTACHDFETVIDIFREFFENHDLTETSLAQFRSVWDPKPR